MSLLGIFHFNLMYSSIEVEDRINVINNVYIPFLEMVDKGQFNIGITMPGYTLEKIKELSPYTFELIKKLVDSKVIEFVGSGYHQIVMPMWPARINKINLKEGDKVYKELLGIKPKILYVNEQCYSKGLSPIIRKAGYECIIIDSYKLGGPKVLDIPVIWNRTEYFQMFQRYVHGDIDLNRYRDYVWFHTTMMGSYMMFYGSDLECFNYRPRKNMHKSDIEVDEIGRIKDFLSVAELSLPSKIYKTCTYTDKDLRQMGVDCFKESRPIIEKKQEKYNINRWCVAGKGNYLINSACYSIIKSGVKITKDMLEFFASDYRTFITEKRLGSMLDRITKHSVIRDANITKIYNNVNTNKGATLNDIKINGINIQTCIPYGTFANNIADFYTGHTCIYTDKKKIVDLGKAEVNKNGTYGVEVIKDALYTNKCYLRDGNKVTLIISILNNIKGIRALRTPVLTFCLDNAITYYTTSNGGVEETYSLSDNFNMSKPLDNHLSSTTGLCCTDGYLKFGNITDEVTVHFNKDICYSQQLLEFYREGTKTMLRIHNSIYETDETSDGRFIDEVDSITMKIDITAKKKYDKFWGEIKS